MDTKERNTFNKSCPKDTTDLKECLHRGINYEFLKFHESDAHYRGCGSPLVAPVGQAFV